MKKILFQALIISVLAGLANAGLAFMLGGSILETPYAGPETTENVPLSQFTIAAAIFSVILSLIGALVLGLLTRKNPARGTNIWRIIGIVFLIIYGVFPFIAPGVASVSAGILVNILHLVAGVPMLLLLPGRAGLVPNR